MGRYISKKQNIQEANLFLEKRLISENIWSNTPTLSSMDEQNQPAYSKDQLKSMGIEIQKGLTELVNKLKGKTIKFDIGGEDQDLFVLNLDVNKLSSKSKKEPSIEGEITVEYSYDNKGSKLRPQLLTVEFFSTNTPMVKNEFTSPFGTLSQSVYSSTELQNYLNNIVIKVLKSNN